jgi:inorganic pyrophosphatase
MAKNKDRGVVDFTKLKPTTKDHNVRVVVETMRGSRNKYAFDPDERVFTLKKVLPEGMVFPHDFGFIPSTEADDGDPIDVLLLMDDAAFAGCVVEARLIGVIEGEQTKEGKKERNDRLLAVAESSHTHSNVKSIDDLNKSLLREVEQFFVNYHENDDTEFKVLACKGPGAAAKCLKKALK